MIGLGTLIARHVVIDANSLTLSWQSIAAMVSISSAVSTAAMVYLRAVWGKDLTNATSTLSEKIITSQVATGDRLRAEIEKAIVPVERHLEEQDRKIQTLDRKMEGKKNASDGS